MRSLSRLRGRVGVGVPPRVRPFELKEPPPAALFERVDLPRKRERCTEHAETDDSNFRLYSPTGTA